MSRDFFRLRSGSPDEEVMNRKGEAIATMGRAPVMKSRKSEGNRARDGGGKSKKEVLSQRAWNYTTFDYIIRYIVVKESDIHYLFGFNTWNPSFT